MELLSFKAVGQGATRARMNVLTEIMTRNLENKR
jgi:hypothetical protein